MDVKFLSAYNEVAQDNFIAVVRQNLVFQTQIKVLEDQVKLVGDLQKKIEENSELQREYKKVLAENTDLKNQLNNANSIVANNNKTNSEQNRIQSALNEKMREFNTLKQSFDRLENQLKDNTVYIEQLHEMLPNAKRKKLGLPIEEKTKETTDDNSSSIEVSSGGSF
jgi:chromosome segregation ATPase